MKKLLTLTLALALMLCLSVPAFAANETSGQTDLTLNYTGSPTYTVTIPSTLTLTMGNNNLSIGVSDTANLNGKSVIVTFEGTQDALPPAAGDGMYNTALVKDATYEIYYKLYNENNVALSTTSACQAGLKLASFDADGSKNLKLEVLTPVSNRPNGSYTGTITFGIGLSS